MTMKCWTVVYYMGKFVMQGYVVAGNKQAAERRAEQRYGNYKKVIAPN
ncbi:hypothetical protein SBP1_gp103 [Vibrio virus vB_VspP_SBP1]|uniref:Uncharacterized protein n=1 Tax=Vibrio virus vB_VspP_SBP1 TaxID=2500581 RepID=A0A3T0IIN9_9CAUD|nr:hypothetical protein KNU36_gp026 [Vibrio virus vB_VspP_SBP1]AZU99695.1 hypothetical protein SBP1_gp103 [Vibrio virus vB_VspP_SBP1]